MPEEMEKVWTGVFLMFRLEIEESVRDPALKNFGLVTPPLEPLPSHQREPSPSMRWSEAPVTVMDVPETEMRGPSHSS